MLNTMITLIGLFLLAGPAPLLPAMEQGDQAFTALQYPEAAASYSSAFSAAGDSAGVLWRLARVYVCMADVAPEASTSTRAMTLPGPFWAHSTRPWGM